MVDDGQTGGGEDRGATSSPRRPVGLPRTVGRSVALWAGGVLLPVTLFLLLAEEVPILPLTYEREHLLVKPWVSRYPTSATQAAFWKDVVIQPRESGFPDRPLD